MDFYTAYILLSEGPCCVLLPVYRKATGIYLYIHLVFGGTVRLSPFPPNNAVSVEEECDMIISGKVG